MRVLVEIAQQTNVHLFKNIIWGLEKKGHQVMIVARDRELTLQLLDIYGFKYISISIAKPGLIHLFQEMIERDVKMVGIVRRFKPDILIGHTTCFTQVSRITGVKSILDHDDGKTGGLLFWFSYPFADVYCTPSCLKGNFGEKHVKYNGYKELAYLHPNHFKPNPKILDELGLKKDEKFFVLRFSALQAVHDVGKKGIGLEMRRRIIKELEKYGRVFITSEAKISPEFERYRIPVLPHKIHDMLYYAQMYIGDSQTMASEAAVLGTPSIRSNSFVGKISYLEELEHRYGLTYGFKVEDQDKMLLKIKELLQDKNLKERWHEKRKRMLKDKIDVAQFLVEFIENFPQSFYDYKRRHSAAKPQPNNSPQSRKERKV